MIDLHNLKNLQTYLRSCNLGGYELHSRIHRLRSLSSSAVNCFIKRDDELSFSISGSKMRKYCSLIPALLKMKIEQVILIGGAFSNNILGLSQLIIENGMKPILFLRSAGSSQIQGNRLFIELLVAKNQIRWISRADWSNVELIAQEYIKETEILSFIVPEGAFIKESFPGALTLALDIVDNESTQQLHFDHIFIDSGTGLQAIALILGMHAISHLARIHVVLLADDAKTFVSKLHQFSKDFTDTHNFHQKGAPTNFEVYLPESATSFGSVNQHLFKEIISIARVEGLFLDPIYSVKLFITGRKIIQEQRLKGNILFIHSGGAFSLSGFQEQLLKEL